MRTWRKSWKRWAESNNERAGSQKSFGMALDGKGYERSKENDMRGYKGIALKPQPIDLDLNDADEQPAENG